MPTVNLLAVLVAAVVNMVLGALWYSPVLFAKPWKKLVGLTDAKMEAAKKNMGATYGVMFLCALVSAYVLSVVVGYANATTLIEGAFVGFWVWLGFVATTMLSSVLFEGKPLQLYKIDAGYHLVALLLNGAILAMWR